MNEQTEQPKENLSRDEKARQELKQKVETEAKQKIHEAIETIKKEAHKISKQEKPYIALQILQETLPALESKTIVMHQPHIVPMTEEEIKQLKERQEQEQKMFEDMKKEQERRKEMPEDQKPKTIPPQ